MTWIGLFFEDNVWKWVDNSVYDWSNWKPNSEESQNCVSVTLTNDFHWEKAKCEEPRSFFCELHQGRCNFRMYPNSSLSGKSILKRTQSIGYCMSVCVDATEITCLSFEYSRYLGTCKLNNVNKWIKQDSYQGHDPTWSYYHRTCVHGISGVMDPHHYVIYNTSKNWYEAQDMCKSEGGFLATVYDEATFPESGYIGQYMTKTMWIGLSRTPERYWRWVGNTSLTWQNWKYQPKPTDRSEKCTMVILDDHAYWYPTVCQTNLWFICQFPADECIYQKTSEAAVLANNKRIYYDISVSECQELCDNTTEFQCRSYEYFRYSGGICQLSEGNRWTLAAYYKTDLFGWDYYHKQCNFGGPLPEVHTTTTVTTTTTTPKPTTEELLTTTEPPTTVKHTTTTEEPSSTTKPTFDDIKNELVAMGDKIREKRLRERRTSAVDNRPSATGAGVVATIILGSIIALVVVLDIGTIKATCEQHRRRKKTRHPGRHAEENYAFEMDNHRKDSLLEDDEVSDIVRVEREDDDSRGGISITGNHIEIQMNNPDDTLEDSTNESCTRSINSDDIGFWSSPVRTYHGERFGHIGTQTTQQELDDARKLWIKYRGIPTFNKNLLKSKNIETQTVICSFDVESSVDGDSDQGSPYITEETQF
ncbi:uncharacterized protein LOC117338999 [Pecten maximus]|uniref:uncharacterized protein LOC117338999 n=1 Tax=Pecten maximus TaxID=6579 RepID=UPI00145913AA|nr:uncharacterized protein LOC117338999 [Pecten maximus]